jgi:F-type H+-transporting ATPase subunit b
MRNPAARTRFSALVPGFGISFRHLLPAMLVAAALAAPFRLPAQQAAPAAVPAAQAPASSSAEAAKPEAADSEEEQTNVFRLEGPVVRWTATTFHLSREATASIFEIINFLIVVVGIGYPLARWLPKFLRGRREKLRTDIDFARKTSGDANARLSAIEAKLSGLDGEIARIRAQVEAEGREDEKRIKASLQEESARIVAAAGQEIDASAAQARRSLRDFAADLAIGQAARDLALTPETDAALIAEFLSDEALNPTPGNGAKKGGQK